MPSAPSSGPRPGPTHADVATIDPLIDQLRQEGAQHETYPVATESDVRMTADALGMELAPSFRTFVCEFSNGAYLYGLQEVSAVGHGNAQIVAIHEVDRLSQDLERDQEIPFFEADGTVRYGDTIPFSLDSNGNEWCFLGTGDSPVAYLATEEGEIDRYRLFGRLNSFTDWLHVLIDSHGEDEVIRTLYKDRDDVLGDRMMLG